jgi:dihydroxyacetone kinase-like protein
VEKMKKLLNNPADFVVEMLDGLIKAHSDMIAYAGDDPHSIVRVDAPIKGKVGLATGGGSGHLPVFLGYVGKGMLDGCAVGDVSSPGAEQMLEVTRRIDSGKGVVYIYGNYGGDVMNFDMASEMAAFDGIQVKTVLVRDDVASAPPEEAHRRRGVAGMVFAFKIAGAMADRGGDIDEVVSVTEKALRNIRHRYCLPCTVPMAGRPTLRSVKMRWKSGWVSTVSRVRKERNCSQRIKLQRR